MRIYQALTKDGISIKGIVAKSVNMARLLFDLMPVKLYEQWHEDGSIIKDCGAF